MGKRRHGNTFLCLQEKEPTVCPICEQNLTPKSIPLLECMGTYCLRCHIFFYCGQLDPKMKEQFTMVSPKALNSFRRTYLNISKQPKMTYHLNKEPIESYNVGREGYCIKCGEPVYRKEKYCFECFKAQKSE